MPNRCAVHHLIDFTASLQLYGCRDGGCAMERVVRVRAATTGHCSSPKQSRDLCCLLLESRLLQIDVRVCEGMGPSFRNETPFQAHQQPARSSSRPASNMAARRKAAHFKQQPRWRKPVRLAFRKLTCWVQHPTQSAAKLDSRTSCTPSPFPQR